MTAPDDDGWKRLGELLTQRRVELDPRYRVRKRFEQDTGLHWRMLLELEKGKRDNYFPTTLAAVEVAYRWQPGSVATILAGGDPVPMPGTPGAPKPEPLPGFDRDDAALVEKFRAFLDWERAQQAAGRERSA